MTQFHISNIEPEWLDLVNEFPHIFLELSPEIIGLFKQFNGEGDFPNTLEECCNLRYSFECPVEWKGIIREFCLEMDELMNLAKENGHDFRYYPFILKEKFGSCRDQGIIVGEDREKYRKCWNIISSKLYDKSLKIK